MVLSLYYRRPDVPLWHWLSSVNSVQEAEMLVERENELRRKGYQTKLVLEDSVKATSPTTLDQLTECTPAHSLEQAPPGYDTTAPRPGLDAPDPTMEQAPRIFDPEASSSACTPTRSPRLVALETAPPGYESDARCMPPLPRLSALEMAPPWFEKQAGCPTSP